MNRIGVLVGLLVILTGCQSSIGPTVNGIYSGGLYDYSAGYIGGFAIDVSTSGQSVNGTACFVATTGETACNALQGHLSNSTLTFQVGAVYFDSVVAGPKIDGSYSSSAGAGTFTLTKSTTAQITLEPESIRAPAHKSSSVFPGALRP